LRECRSAYRRLFAPLQSCGLDRAHFVERVVGLGQRRERSRRARPQPHKPGTRRHAQSFAAARAQLLVALGAQKAVGESKGNTHAGEKGHQKEKEKSTTGEDVKAVACKKTA
jgi:hypothetical protein